MNAISKLQSTPRKRNQNITQQTNKDGGIWVWI